MLFLGIVSCVFVDRVIERFDIAEIDSLNGLSTKSFVAGMRLFVLAISKLVYLSKLQEKHLFCFFCITRIT